MLPVGCRGVNQIIFILQGESPSSFSQGVNQKTPNGREVKAY